MRAGGTTVVHKWDQLPLGYVFVPFWRRAEGPAVAPGWRCPDPRVDAGRVGPRAVVGAFQGLPDGQAVISASTGALRLRTMPPPGGLLPAFRTSLAAAAAAFRPSSTATLRYVSAVSTTLEWPSWSAIAFSSTPASSISVAAPWRRSCSRTGGRPVPPARSLNLWVR